jgi:hypothetical protein
MDPASSREIFDLDFWFTKPVGTAEGAALPQIGKLEVTTRVSSGELARQTERQLNPFGFRPSEANISVSSGNEHKREGISPDKPLSLRSRYLKLAKPESNEKRIEESESVKRRDDSPRLFDFNDNSVNFSKDPRDIGSGLTKELFDKSILRRV